MVLEVDPRSFVGRGLYQVGNNWTNEPRGVLRYIVADDIPPPNPRIPLYGGVASGLRNDPPDPRSSSPLGYAWTPENAPPGAVSIEQNPPSVSTAQGSRGQGMGTHEESLGLGIPVHPRRRQQVIVDAAGSRSTIMFNLEAGGMVESWLFEDDLRSTEIVNHGNSFQRGFQAGMSWTDESSGELTCHHAVQGGDIFSSRELHRFGGVTKSFVVDSPASGGVRVRMSIMPLEADPVGMHTIPGVSTYHGGGVGRPVYWQGLEFNVTLWLHWRGLAGTHKIELEAVPGFELDTGWFDVELYYAMFLDATVFPLVRALRPDSTETVLSTGTLGDVGYQADWRRYTSIAAGWRGDDETVLHPTISPTAIGSISATGAADSDFAVSAISNHVDDSPNQGVRNFDGSPNGNGFSWTQGRNGEYGPDGSNAVVIAPGRFMSNRVHGNERRRIRRRPTRVESFIHMGSLADARVIFPSLELAGS